METSNRWEIPQRESPETTVYRTVPPAAAGAVDAGAEAGVVAGAVDAGVFGAAAVRCVVRTMPGWSMLDALMPLSRCSCAAETPVRRAMIHHPSFGCTV